MFQRLYDLSHFLSSSEQEPWQRINEGMPAEYTVGFALCFSKEGEWQGVETIYKNEGIVYRSGPSNGTDFTPCCKLASDTANRLLKVVKKLAGYAKLPENKKRCLKASIQCFESGKEKIWQDVETKAKFEALDKTKRGFVYWVIDSKPVYEWQEAKAFLQQQFLIPFAKGGTRIGTCSVCGQQELEVYGNVSIVACYNLDKPGSIAGGFKDKEAHRNFPVCQNCAFSIAQAFTFAENHLTSSMAGQTYMVLPYTADEEIYEQLHETIKAHPERYQLSKTDLVCEEIELVEEFGKQGKQIALAVIFFEKKQASWRLQAEIQQLLPNRLHELHEAAEKMVQAEDLFGKDDKPLQISARTFKTFSGTLKKSGKSELKSAESTLRTWLVALFEKHPIDYKVFLHQLVSRMISTGKADSDKLGWITRQAWGLYRYALETQLIKLDNIQGETNMPKAIPESSYGEYIKEHSEFFHRQEIVAAFLTGCYASVVAFVQHKKRNATPFTKKFIGRLLSKEQLQNIYREGHTKLTQYDKLGYVFKKEGKGLDPDLANAWVACGEQWNISDEETTFVFTIGYSLAYRIHQLYSDNDSLEDHLE
jgi:CRISPR-associated protein Csh1